jgi:hypothetical protein
MGVIRYSGWLTPALCQLHPEKLFVFGDNLRGFGKGGQAIIRDEPNAFGVPTKRKPSMSPGSFFKDDSEADLDEVLGTLEELWRHLKSGKTIVIPVTDDGKVSLGLERAELPQRAPTIYEAICRHVGEMCDSYGAVDAKDLGKLNRRPN